VWAGLTPGRALVVAMGDGRNAAHLARLGFAVDGIDVSFEGARRALERIRAGGGSLGAVVADLDEFPLPTARYDLVAVQNFLNRRLFPFPGARGEARWSRRVRDLPSRSRLVRWTAQHGAPPRSRRAAHRVPRLRARALP
jgi:SAM-dependent methyltransferase